MTDFAAFAVFEGLPGHGVDTLREFLEELEGSPGDQLFAVGDYADSLFLIAEGEAELFAKDSAGADTLVGSLVAGQCIGELSAMHPSRRGLTMRAKTQLRVFEFSNAAFQELSIEDAHVALAIAQNVLKLAAQRTHALAEELGRTLA